MHRVSSFFILVLAVSVLSVLRPSPAVAGEWDELTYFTFSAPVEIPGAALPAGTYMFRLADADGARNVVQVLSKDGSKVYATFIAIPDDRLTAPDHPLVTFAETPAGTPEAIKAWFYLGDKSGYEFIYPKDQAKEIAAATRQPMHNGDSAYTEPMTSLQGTHTATAAPESQRTTFVAKKSDGSHSSRLFVVGTAVPHF